MIDGITYVSHEEPAWRGSGHYMAMVDLAVFDLPGMREQIWLRETGVAGEYEVCCIPFYAYGMALGDVVGKSAADMIGQSIRKSGRRALRVLFTAPRPLNDSRSALRAALDSVGLLSEWNGDRQVAIDVPDMTVIQPVVDAIQAEILGKTAFWEWSDSKHYDPA
ncbi:DUF4265 domain-containing protein [Streptomyces sp. NPDC091217]|uniref:DUF4265 domain-containing protein n=1 Tax=Streptomyces sp. NPDC091217 TaxID=3365975 RepID=UPI0038130B9F